MNDQNAFLTFVQKSFAHDIAGATFLLEGLPEDEAAKIFQALPVDVAERAIRNLQISFAADLLKTADDSFMGALAAKLDPQLAGAILSQLPPEYRQRMKDRFSDKLQEQIREHLDYPEGSVGRIMTANYLAFNQNLKAEDAIEKIRALAKRRYPVSYAYVVDDENCLRGVLNMRDLMLAPPDQRLGAIILPEIFSIHAFTDVRQAASELARRKYFAAPVVDGSNHIVGIIKAERMIQGAREEATQDIQKMFGAGGDEKAFSSIPFSLRKRLPWLHVNLATAFMAAAVVAMFEGIIAKLTVLAVFLPVVAGQGGNAGAQSLAVVMRGIVMREIPHHKILPLIRKEAQLGTINGVVIGIVTAMVAWIWYGNIYLGLVIGLGMLLNLFFAGLAGASIPLLMRRLGLDPAQSSNIILTTVTDVMGFMAFLSLAVIFQQFLL
ncbi:MAG: magnesium transporter [Desulfobacteraceae bacterium]|nr:magnesium transporter [Desulfobacteraceae bacterium]MBC2749870.1 magnesium transporter [Desulfobacteraceae bacterium]